MFNWRVRLMNLEYYIIHGRGVGGSNFQLAKLQ
ncbi:MAG: hypothetical protein ACI80S_001095, partial [Pseudohongiellaceae bacterium]